MVSWILRVRPGLQLHQFCGLELLLLCSLSLLAIGSHVQPGTICYCKRALSLSPSPSLSLSLSPSLSTPCPGRNNNFKMCIQAALNSVLLSSVSEKRNSTPSQYNVKI
ncbi:hypothetical protein RRG08_036021 [Elysia crispata]|uniref:Secreted protein n=1 Tax=Elysia crispata TaxID=231223 RepID=A0AAE1AL85_9GAST|nr:hypothetical protein RRG08_036021 [Elysia crispata]